MQEHVSEAQIDAKKAMEQASNSNDANINLKIEEVEEASDAAREEVASEKVKGNDVQEEEVKGVEVQEEDVQGQDVESVDSEEDGVTDAGSGIDALDADLETWERLEDEYGVFQREPVEFIHYHFVYMGREEGGHYVRDVRSKVLEFAEGITQLESSVLMSLIKNNEIHSRRRYKVYKMLRYNVTATLPEVEAAVKAMSRGNDTPPSADAATYITELDGFPTVAYEDTMIELEEHNALFVFMVEDVAAKGAHRRRSRGHQKPTRRATTRRAVTQMHA